MRARARDASDRFSPDLDSVAAKNIHKFLSFLYGGLRQPTVLRVESEPDVLEGTLLMQSCHHPREHGEIEV